MVWENSKHLAVTSKAALRTDPGEWELENQAKGFDPTLGFILLALLFTCVDNFSIFIFLQFEMVALVL